MRKKNKWRTAFILTLTILFTSLSACGNRTNETSEDGKDVVKIGYLPITHALAIFEEAEMLKESEENVEIKLVKFGSWTDLMDALNAEQIDGASVLIELAMNAVSNGIHLKAVALGHKDGNVIVVSNEIQSVADLKGKTFAIPSNQSSHNILLNEMLKNAGLSKEDITITQLSPAEMPSSLATGAIDGYCVAEPFGAQAVTKEIGQVLYKSNELWEDSQCCSLVFNQNFLDQKKEVAQTILTNYFEAGKKLEEEEAKRIATLYLGQEEATLEQSLQWISYEDLTLTKEDYQILCDKVIDYGMNENPPLYEDFVYQE